MLPQKGIPEAREPHFVPGISVDNQVASHAHGASVAMGSPFPVTVGNLEEKILNIGRPE